MAIYKPSLLDKFKDFVNGIRANWQEYEAHVADFEAHVADFEAHVADFEAHVADFEAHLDQYEAHVDNTTDAHGIDEHVAATAEDDVHGLLSGGFIIEESGSNDDGSWVRWSNGLQICWIPSITLRYVNTAMLRARWDYPAEFKSGSTPAGFANPREYAPVDSARTAGTVVSCYKSSCLVSASTGVGIFGEDDTWNFQVVAIGWWK